jgi:hypothetical protein
LTGYSIIFGNLFGREPVLSFWGQVLVLHKKLLVLNKNITFRKKKIYSGLLQVEKYIFSKIAMSESDGLHKLTAYLNQTRRQAEAAVDALNIQIKERENKNEKYELLCLKLEEDKNYYKNLCEQLKLEGTTKHRLQERDDWKALIDSVQKERSRLQEHCTFLESELDSAKAEILELQGDLTRIYNEAQQGGSVMRTISRSDSRTTSVDTDESNLQTPPKRGSVNAHNMIDDRLSMSLDAEDGDFAPTSQASSPMLMSPFVDANGRVIADSSSMPPKALAKQLKYELKKAHSQVWYWLFALFHTSL